MRTLALDCSQNGVSLAIFDEIRLFADVSCQLEAQHSQALLRRIDEALHEAKTDLSQISHVLFCHGPGSFTSLRIGLATLMGLFLCSDAAAPEFYQTSSLLFRCVAMKRYEKERAVVLMKAGRQRIYCGSLAPESAQGDFQECVMSPEETAKFLFAISGPAVVTGDGLDIVEPSFWQSHRHALRVLPNSAPSPRAFQKILKNPQCCYKTPLDQARLNYLLEPDIG